MSTEDRLWAMHFTKVRQGELEDVMSAAIVLSNSHALIHSAPRLKPNVSNIVIFMCKTIQTDLQPFEVAERTYREIHVGNVVVVLLCAFPPFLRNRSPTHGYVKRYNTKAPKPAADRTMTFPFSS